MLNKNKEIKNINRLEIKGLWNEIDIKWDLDPKVNILIGKNGMGKTTLLKLITAIINEEDSFYKDSFQSVSLLFNEERYIEVQKVSDFDDVDKKIINVNKYKLHIGEFIPSKSKKLKMSYLTQENILSKQEAEETRSSSKFLKYIKVENINTFDLSMKELDNMSITKHPEVKTGLDIILYELINDFKNYQLKLRNREKKSSELLNAKVLEISLDESENKKSAEEITKELKFLLLNKDKEIKKIYQQQDYFIKIVNKLFADTGKKLDFNESNAIIFRKRNKVILPNQLSSGEKQLLIILLTIIQQEKNPSIILMDEPELSLHLSWQIELIDSIQKLNPNSQLILATHSPSVFMNGWHDKVTQIEDIISVSTSI